MTLLQTFLQILTKVLESQRNKVEESRSGESTRHLSIKRNTGIISEG